MRTDVKVGVISAFVLVLAVVAYYAWQANKSHTPPEQTTGLTDNKTDSTPAPTDNTAGAILIKPPGEAATQTGGPAVSSANVTGPGGLDTSAATAPSATYPALMGSVPTTTPATGTGALASGSASSYGSLGSSSYTGSTPGSSTATESTGGTSSLGSSFTDTSSTAGLSTGATTYVIKAGDTFAKLAKAHKLTTAAIEKANPGVNPGKLKIGQKINLPTPAAPTVTSTDTTSGLTSHSATTKPAKTARTTTKSHTAKTSTVKATGTKPSAKPGVPYTVKEGDTLKAIAKAAYGSDLAAARILRANRSWLHSASQIKAGDVLEMPE